MPISNILRRRPTECSSLVRSVTGGGSSAGKAAHTYSLALYGDVGAPIRRYDAASNRLGCGCELQAPVGIKGAQRTAGKKEKNIEFPRLRARTLFTLSRLAEAVCLGTKRLDKRQGDDCLHSILVFESV